MNYRKAIPLLKTFLEKARQRLKTQSGKNVIFSGGGAMVNPILQLVAVPILFKRLGAEDFGIWALINAVIATSGIANLGLGDAATKYVAKHRARSDLPRVISVIRSIFLLYIVLGGLAAAAVWLAAPWIASHGFKVEIRTSHPGDHLAAHRRHWHCHSLRLRCHGSHRERI